MENLVNVFAILVSGMGFLLSIFMILFAPFEYKLLGLITGMVCGFGFYISCKALFNF